MNEEQIRAIVRDEVERILEERETNQVNSDYFLEEIRERQEKRERIRRAREEDERRRLEDRISDLERQGWGR